MSIMGLNFVGTKPIAPVIGDTYFDNVTVAFFTYDGTNWLQLSGSPKEEEDAKKKIDKTISDLGVDSTWDNLRTILKIKELSKENEYIKELWDELFMMFKLSDDQNDRRT